MKLHKTYFIMIDDVIHFVSTSLTEIQNELKNYPKAYVKECYF